MSPPTLSVMMSNYNHAQFILDALEAILAQSRRPVEIVIIDDGSTDDSVSILERFARKEPGLIRLIRNERNLGLLVNVQRLLGMATGDCVYFPACDDQILPEFFERAMHLLSRHPAAGLCSTLSGIMDESGTAQGLVQTPIVRHTEGYLAPDEALAALLQHGSWFMGNATIFHRIALIEAGGFMAELGPYCDGFISLVLALKHGACFIPEPLAVWRRMETTYSRRVSMDLDATVRNIQTAERLMRSKYHHLFPADYVDEWKREVTFGAAASFVASSADGRLTGLKRLIPRYSVADQAFLSTVRRWPRLGRALAKLYLFARFRRKHLWRAAVRKLKYRLHPRWRALSR